MPIVVLVRYRAQSGKHDLAAREIAALVKAVTTTERGCLGISMLQSDSDDGQLLLHERWTDKDTYFGPHMQTPHIQSFIQAAGAFLEGPPDISLWHEGFRSAAD